MTGREPGPKDQPADQPADQPVELGSAQEIPGVARPMREPGFLERGRASFRQTLREAADYKALRTTPYGLKPALVLMVVGSIAAFDGRIFGQAAPEIIRDLDVDLLKVFQIFNVIGPFIVVAVILLAFLADRVRRVPFIGIGAIVSGIGSMLTSRSYTETQLGVFRGADAIGDTILSVPQTSLMADYYPPESRGKVFALSGVLGRAVGLAAPLSVAVLVTRLGWRIPFVVTGLLLVVAGVAVFGLLKEPVRGYMERRSLGVSEEVAVRPEEPPSFGEAWRTIWSIRTLRRLFIAEIPGSAGDGIFSFFAMIWLFQRYGLDINQRALIATFTAIVMLPFGFLAGGMVDVLIRRRPSRVLVLSGSLGVVSSFVLFLYALGPPLWLLIGISLAFGAAGALLGPARAVLFVQILPAHVRTLGGSMIVLATIPGTVVRFLAVTYLFSRFGVQGAMMAAAPLVLVSALMALSAAGFFERDMRAAMSSQLASEEWRRAQAAGAAKLLVCRDVDVEYDGIQVLFGVDFDVEEGDVIALLGTNGAGKSTLLKAIAGLQEASAGAVVLDGREITHMPPQEVAKRGVVLMPGGRGVFPTLTVRENLRLGNWLNEDAEARERLDEVFGIFPVLRERLDERAQVLSGGEQQMLSLAQAFLARPKLLMIDELSLGLAPAVVEQLLEIVRRIHAAGTTIILVEQSVNVALTVCERAVFMEKGEVRFVGRTADLLRRPDILRAVYVKGTGALTEAAPAGARRTAREQRRHDLEGVRAVLEVRGVSKSFGGVHALTDVSLELRDGEVLGLIGPNGAGKTTLFDVISGYQRADSGEVVYDGADVTRMGPDERARLRLVRRFQDARLFPALSVYENLLVALDRKLDIRSIPLTAMQLPQVRSTERRVRQRADRLVELLELGANRDKYVRELSTGLRRITDLACVLAAEPKVLLLDEPSSGIAQAEAESLGPLLRRVRHEVGCSILVIEHDMPLISSVSDEMIAMDQGQVVVRGTPEAVLNDERVIGSYLGTSQDVIQRSGIKT